MTNFNKCLPVFLLLVACFVGIDAKELSEASRPQWDRLTYDYPLEQLQGLRNLPLPKRGMTPEKLSRLTDEVTYILNTEEIPEFDQTVIPAYIANAQKDFAWLSVLTTGEPKGDLGPVTLWTLRLFIPDVNLPSVHEDAFDVYTSYLSSIVVSKSNQRLTQERANLKDYPIKKGQTLWRPTAPGYVSLNLGSMKTWFLSSSDEFVIPEPTEDKEFWKAQCEDVISEQRNLDGKKVHAIFQWAGLTGINDGTWEKIVNDYIKKERMPLMEQLYLRALLSSALVDANAVAAHSKYTYWVMRPSQMDSRIKPYLSIPNHPSCPSAHSTIAGTAATILSKLIPQEKERWNALAEESGMSRIWGGIHYPVDHKEGLNLGNEIGNRALERNFQRD
ncbi:MAG: vanadium-dependent haloperoxidase [Waddliaceae bacterium]